MAGNSSEQKFNSNIVNFAEKQVSEWQDFEVLSNTIYRVSKSITISTADEDQLAFISDHCQLLFSSTEGSGSSSGSDSGSNQNGIESYKFNKGELYLYVNILVGDDTEPSEQLIPLTTPVDTIVDSETFKTNVDEYVNEYIEKSQLITRNQLRIRSNNIQAWVVNNFIAKNAKGESNFIPGTVKVNEQDPKYGYLGEKLVSSDDSITIKEVNSEDGKKLNITTKINGIAFADVLLGESDWSGPDSNGLYFIDLSRNQKVIDSINSDRSDCYVFIKGIDAYIKNSDGTFSEFSVDKVYAYKDSIDPVDKSIHHYYYYLKLIKSLEKHEIRLVLYLTNGSVPGDSSSGGSGPSEYIVSASVNDNTLTLVPNQGDPIEFTPSGGSGEPDAYVKSFEISQDGKSLTLVNKDNSQQTFAPPTGATQLSELSDFSNQQGLADLAMLQSLLEITRAE